MTLFDNYGRPIAPEPRPKGLDANSEEAEPFEEMYGNVLKYVSRERLEEYLKERNDRMILEYEEDES
jgi:hypothetical protein